MVGVGVWVWVGVACSGGLGRFWGWCHGWGVYLTDGVFTHVLGEEQRSKHSCHLEMRGERLGGPIE